MSIPWIAEETVDLVAADGRRTRVRLAIALPVAVAAGGARCDVWIEGLEDKPHQVFGESSLQALVLALRLLAEVLACLEQQGTRLVYSSDDSKYEVEVMFAGLSGTSAATPRGETGETEIGETGTAFPEEGSG